MNIDKVDQLIEENPYISYDEIQAETSISRGTIFTIIHDQLKLRKITSRWVPHLLTQKHNDDRVRICVENLKKIESGAWRLGDILTGDESWFYLKQIGRKQANKSWVEVGESPKMVVRQGNFDKKSRLQSFSSEVVPCIYLGWKAARLLTIVNI